MSARDDDIIDNAELEAYIYVYAEDAHGEDPETEAQLQLDAAAGGIAQNYKAVFEHVYIIGIMRGVSMDSALLAA